MLSFAKQPQTIVEPIDLDANEFVKKVHNFKKNPNQFTYLGDKPAIIDFHATWCGPCKQLAPTLKALAAEYGEEIYIYKVDIDREPDIARAYGIRSVPSLLFIPHDDAIPQMGQGNIPKESLKKVIDEFMLGKQVE
jgi:thioredoxin